MDNREAIEWLKGCVVAYEVDNKGKPNGNVTCELIQEVIDMAITALEKQEQAENEWCPDCAEYDKENHCCHRFTKVIRQTVEECKREWANEGWIPVTERLPKHGTTVLITNSKGNVSYGRFRGVELWKDGGDGYWTWKKNTVEQVRAWRPLPEAYTEEEA